MGILYLVIKPMPSTDRIFEIHSYLKSSFPRAENRTYLHSLTKNLNNLSISRVVLSRLSALALLPPLLKNAGMDPTSMLLARDQYGRPFCANASNDPVFDFNISHSKEHIACALWIGKGRVGIDVEEPMTSQRALSLIRRYCTNGEHNLLKTLSNEQCALEFTRIWTVREAIAKQEGRGEPLRYDASTPPPSVIIKSGVLTDTNAYLSICLPCVESFDRSVLSHDSLIPTWI